MSKKIMFVMNQMSAGGAERVISILANGISRRGHNVSLIITFESELYYDLDNEIDIINFNISTKQKQIYRNFIEIKKLINEFRKKQPDIIISFIRNVNCILAAKIVGIPVIISERNNPKHDPKSKVWRIARKIIYPYANGIVFQTKGAQNFFGNRIKKKSCIIQNPLDDNMPIKSDKNLNKIIVSVGRLTEQKDHKTLIKAFSKFHYKNPFYKLIIYGEGQLRNELQELILDLKMNDYIFLAGNEKNIYEKISEADIFIFSSIYEGYPNALIEAMAIGLPVISTDCSYGPREIIDNGKNGFLVPVRDFEEIANKIDILISNDTLRNEIQINSIKIRQILSCDNIINKWIEYIYLIIEEEKC